MRRVTLNPNNTAASLNEIARASAENDPVEIAQNFTITGALTQTLNLNLTAPSLANVAAVLGTLLTIMQKGGLHRNT